MGQSYKSDHNFVYSCKFHLVWCPKYRRKVLTGGIADRLKEILHELAVESNSEIMELEVMPDHVHLLVEIPPHYGVAKFVRMSKGRSSRILRDEFPVLKTRLPTLWTNATFISSVGGAPPAMPSSEAHPLATAIKQYIQQQQRSERKPKPHA